MSVKTPGERQHGTTQWSCDTSTKPKHKVGMFLQNTMEAKCAKALCPHYFPFPTLLILYCAMIGHCPCQPPQVGFSLL